MPLVFSLPFCLLLPDGDYQVKIDKDEIVTLNLTKVIPKIFDERLPYRGFLKGELENIDKLRIWDEKRGSGGWVSVDQLKAIHEKKFVIEYKTKDGKKVVPEVDPSIIAKDTDISQDININPEAFARSLGEEPFSPETLNQMSSEMGKHGRRLVINAEIKKDPYGRFRYTKVRFAPNKDLGFEEQREMALKSVNILISKYRQTTGDYWITKVREEDFFVYRSVEDNSPDLTQLEKGISQIRPDHNQHIVDGLRESLMSDIPFPFTHLFLDAKNAFERADYYLAVILSIVAAESIIKTYLTFYSLKCPPVIQDEVNRINLTRLVTKVLPKIFVTDGYKMLMGNVTKAIELRNNIIHQSETDIPKDMAEKVIEDVRAYMEFIQGKIVEYLDQSST